MFEAFVKLLVVAWIAVVFTVGYLAVRFYRAEAGKRVPRGEARELAQRIGPGGI